MPDISVSWYDGYGNSHNSPVYFVDPVWDRFLITTDDKNFQWVSIEDCELLKEET